MPLYEELSSLLEAAGVGTRGVDIFASRFAQLPTGDGPYLTMVETGGTSPERIQNQINPPAAQRPVVQVVARAKIPSLAHTMIRNAYYALIVRNRVIDGTWYREIEPRQEPFDLDPDEAGRARFAFNVTVIKAPS